MRFSVIRYRVAAIIGAVVAVLASVPLVVHRALPFTSIVPSGGNSWYAPLAHLITVVHAPAAFLALVTLKEILLPIAGVSSALLRTVWSHWTSCLLIIDVAISSLIFTGIAWAVSMVERSIRARML